MHLSWFLPHLAALAVVTIILGMIYAGVQQSYRSGANDPQAAIAREMALNTRDGKSTDRWLSDSIQLEESLGVFATIYDDRARPTRSSGFLHGKYPQLPKGVFEFVRTHGEDRVTWQPESRVRMAMVVIKSPGEGYIAVGRSLEETEIREERLRWSVFICWIFCIAIIGMLASLQIWFRNRSAAVSSPKINPIA